MAKLIEYDQVETLKDEDIFLIDGERGTKTIAAKNLANDIKKVSLGESTEYTDDRFSKLDDAKLDKTGDASNVTSDIQSATIRTNLTTGEKLAVSLGKIKKFLSDLKTVAFTGSYADLTEKPTSMTANGGNADTVNNHTVDTDVPEDAKFTDTVYDTFVKSGTEAKVGLVPSPPTTAGTTKYLREDGTWAVPSSSIPDDTVTGIKGNVETEYRTGKVNLTSENIGALPISGGKLTGQLQVGEKVKLYTSSEGGNIQIISPDDIGLRWELDAFKGDLRFICFNNDGTVKKICQLTKDGTLIANNATQSAAGLMSPKDKEKLDNLSNAITIGGDTASNIVSFTASTARENLKSGESHATLFGKIVKWFSDLKEVAFTGKIPWSDVTGKPSTYAPSSHTHDERYYTESEVNSIYSGIMQNLISGDENVTTKLSKNIANGDATLDNRITAVANALKGYLPLSGGTLTGSLDIESGKYIHGTHTNGTILDILGLNKNNNCHVGNNTTPTFLHGAGYQLDISGAFICPNVSNQMSCGTKNKLWTTVFSKTGAINTSDRTKKHDIKDLTEVYEKLFLKLQPKSFVFNNGDRVHIGAISQDVEDAMQELGIVAEEFAGFCKDIRYEYTAYNEEDGTPVESSKIPCKDEDGNIIYDYALRYQEFIFLTIHMVQKLWNRVEILEKENAEMRDQIKSIQQDITELKKSRA
ncbi:tail fiber domain-containing protein [Roseburia rectibacter]|uniref:tail fiber domain-containing protein n=1 Tax=Roseburia rectibacter TaxID=2763062 RepID=UPI00164BA345|nr:tail fiber domain-containing protein [Roseburia rectibacter]UMZ01246.1 tail fiber domain-containing protein [Roseburia rectibacter]